MKNRKSILLVILLMVVGFAAVSTTLFINGSTNINPNQKDFHVYYSDAYQNGVQDKSVITDDTHIVFTTELSTLGEKYILDYEVTNGSKNYDAELVMVCTGGNEYLTVTNDFDDDTILEAKALREGKLTLELTKSYIGDEDLSVTIECTINANALERTSLGTTDRSQISVSAKDENENNLNAKSYQILGKEEEDLLTSLVETGYVDDVSEVDALIEVKSDVFENFATTTFDVSSIAEEGDKVVILHFDEEKQEWEYISEEVVDENGEVTADFTSYSPVAFVVVKDDGEIIVKLVTLTYDANNGELDEFGKTIIYHKEAGELPTPTRVGYTFIGWYTATIDGEEITANSIIKEDITIYAQWTPNNYTVTYDGNGGTPSETSKTVTYDEIYDELTTATRTGYTFVGWYTEATGGTEITADTKVAIIENQTIYAHWTANGYSVTYNGNSGTASETGKNVTYDEPYGELATASRTGYTFAGWYTQVSGGTQVTADTKVSFTGTQNLYAQWTANTYKVTYNANGGSVSPASKDVTYDSTYGTLVTPSRTGYTFAGWYTAASGGTQVTASTKVTIIAAQTIYAHWNVNSYTVAVKSGGNGTVSTSSLSIPYGGTKTFTVTPNTDYYLLSVTCTSGYTVSGFSTGTSYTGKQTVTVKNNSTTSTGTCTATFKSTCTYTAGQTWNFGYTGGVQSFTAQCKGTYKMIAYGANGGAAYSNQGGGANGQQGSRGNYLEGVVTLNKNDVLNIYVGQGGQNGYSHSNSSDVALGSGTFGYGSGGAGLLQGKCTGKHYDGYIGATGAGGGATAFLLNGTAEANRLLVAGGGGGAGSWSQNYMNNTGNSPLYTWAETAGFGGSSTINGTVGQGEKYSGAANDRRIGGGGGGGWLGGGQMKNGTNGINTSKVTSVVSSTSSINTTSYTFSTYNGSSGLVQAATANGSAKLVFVG